VLKTWERITTLAQPWPSFEIGGQSWQLVDEIDLLDKTSESRHAFAIHGAKDAYKHQTTQRYPDGTQVTDVGYAQLEGAFAFTVSGLVAEKPVVILVRTDILVGDFRLAVTAGDKPAGEVAVDKTDPAMRWRNLPVPIPAEHVTGATLDVKLTSLTPGRDIHMFHVWVYQ
jgi:hypothetical protein